MWVAAQANVRVASAAQRSFNEALQVCFRSGAFAAVLVISLCVGGISLLYGACIFLFGNIVPITDTPLLIVGYGFGASFVALFMQLGGGIYTKAADVGAGILRTPCFVLNLINDFHLLTMYRSCWKSRGRYS